MNKKLIAVLFLAVFAVTALSATGVGIQGGYSKINDGNLAVTFKVDELPFVFAANFRTYSYGGLNAGITADYWLVNNNFASSINYFIGVGAGAAIYTWSDYFGLAAVGRLPIGVNAFFLDGILEPYIQVVPQLYALLIPDVNLDFDISVEAGFRFWF